MKNKKTILAVVAALLVLGIGLWAWALNGGRIGQISMNGENVPGPATSTALISGCPTLSKDFTVGTTDAAGGDLDQLKGFLSAKKHLATTTSEGVFNQQVSDALKAWQKSVGLEATGVVDAKVRETIASACEPG